MGYIPILTPNDLTTHIYPEVLQEIVRDDDTKTAGAISQAIQEAKMYLTRYDIIQLFGDITLDVASTFPLDDFLANIIKNIAVWNVAQLGNPNIYYDAWKDRYEQTIATLKNIQKGIADPRWPYFDTTAETAPPSDQVTMIANPKRSNYY